MCGFFVGIYEWSKEGRRALEGKRGRGRWFSLFVFYLLFFPSKFQPRLVLFTELYISLSQLSKLGSMVRFMVTRSLSPNA